MAELMAQLKKHLPSEEAALCIEATNQAMRVDINQQAPKRVPPCIFTIFSGPEVKQLVLIDANNKQTPFTATAVALQLVNAAIVCFNLNGWLDQMILAWLTQHKILVLDPAQHATQLQHAMPHLDAVNQHIENIHAWMRV